MDGDFSAPRYSIMPAPRTGVIDILMVDRPDGLPRLRWEGVVGHWYHETQTQRWYWYASSHVSNAIGGIDPPDLCAWVCRSLNNAVLAGRDPPSCGLEHMPPMPSSEFPDRARVHLLHRVLRQIWNYAYRDWAFEVLRDAPLPTNEGI